MTLHTFDVKAEMQKFSERRESRTYLEYESVGEAMDGVCQLYEQGLKASNPQLKQITYDVGDLFGYLDSVKDFCALVHDSETNAYTPHNKAWIKDQVFKHLKRQAQA